MASLPCTPPHRSTGPRPRGPAGSMPGRLNSGASQWSYFVPDFKPRAGFACFRPRAVTIPNMDLDHLTLLTDMQWLGVGIPMVTVGGRFPTKGSLRDTAWR